MPPKVARALIFIVLASLGACKGAKWDDKPYGPFGPYQCSFTFDPYRACGGTAVYMCNPTTSSKTYSVTREPAWHTEPGYTFTVIAPAGANLSDHTAPLLGPTEFGNKNGVCEPLNYNLN